jgi:hypothetical protein
VRIECALSAGGAVRAAGKMLAMKAFFGGSKNAFDVLMPLLCFVSASYPLYLALP